MKRYFEYSDEKSNKFWSIELTEDDSFTVCYGKIGSDGTEQTKDFKDKITRDKEAKKLIAEKLKKGYIEKGADSKEEEISSPAPKNTPIEKKNKVYNKISKYMEDNPQWFPEFIFDDYDLNYDHYCEMGIGDFCCTSAVWLCSISNTGHDHIGIMPVLNRPVEEWPVGYFDQNEGVLDTFASSLKTWLPGYLIRNTDRDSIKKHKKKVIKTLTPFLAEKTEEFVQKIIKGDDFTDSLYEFIEEGTFLTEYNRLLFNEKTTLEEWKTYIKKYPFFNAPIGHLIDEGLADKEIYERLLSSCILRHDLGNYSFKYLINNAKQICDLFTEKETPLYPMLLDMKKKKDKYGYYKQGEAFYQAGLYYQKQNKLWEAYCCFDNSIFAERCETEDFREDAYIEQIKVAKALKDKAFFSQYEGANLPEE